MINVKDFSISWTQQHKMNDFQIGWYNIHQNHIIDRHANHQVHLEILNWHQHIEVVKKIQATYFHAFSALPLFCVWEWKVSSIAHAIYIPYTHQVFLLREQWEKYHNRKPSKVKLLSITSSWDTALSLLLFSSMLSNVITLGITELTHYGAWLKSSGYTRINLLLSWQTNILKMVPLV